MGRVYLYHDLHGYILEMSPDILAFLAELAEPAEVTALCRRYREAFGGEQPEQFIDVFEQFSCVHEPGEDELAGIWYMVPVKSRWNVWRRDGDTVTLYTAWGDRPASKLVLGAEETRIWDAIDGEQRLGDFKARFDEKVIVALVPRLTHHDVQAIKLSAFPMSVYKGRPNLRPPYLTSTMPYAACSLDGKELVQAGARARGAGEIGGNGKPGAGTEPHLVTLSTRDYYELEVTEPDSQFDHRETTLSHLLRVPHPVLGGRTYGQALVDALVGRELLGISRPLRVLEIGAGLGYVARDAIARLGERGFAVTYEIIELSPVLARVQRERLAGLAATVREGDVLEVELGTGHDLILCNEMIGDLPAVELDRKAVGADLEPAERAHRLAALGQVGALIRDLGLELGDAPETFYLNTGALTLVGRIGPALAPGGVCVITEFGEQARYPRLSSQLDHPELSIHFGHVESAARHHGLTTRFEYIIDLLDFDRDLRGMATTRSYFRALGNLLGEHGVTLDKIGYTDALFDALIAGKVDRDAIGDLYFDRIEDRLMGLVPHEFKALLVQRPA